MTARLVGLLLVATLLQPGQQAGALFGKFHYPNIDAPDMSRLKPDVRRLVERRLATAAAYRPRYRGPSDVEVYLQAIERAIVSITGTSAVANEALAFANDVHIDIEWDEDSGPPLIEAESAAQYFRAHPRTAIAAYLRLFLLQRYRCVFEAAGKERDVARQQNAAAAYKAVWAQLRRERDPVVKAIADDIDAGPYLYVSIGQHPRR